MAYPNHIWGVVITYILRPFGKLYLAAIFDWYSRYVVSGQLEQSLYQQLVTKLLEQALQVAKPEIFNSNQASNFTSLQYPTPLLILCALGELNYLALPNHGWLFKVYMSAYLLDWQEQQRMLKEYGRRGKDAAQSKLRWFFILESGDTRVQRKRHLHHDNDDNTCREVSIGFG